MACHRAEDSDATKPLALFLEKNSKVPFEKYHLSDAGLAYGESHRIYHNHPPPYNFADTFAEDLEWFEGCVGEARWLEPIRPQLDEFIQRARLCLEEEGDSGEEDEEESESEEEEEEPKPKRPRHELKELKATPLRCNEMETWPTVKELKATPLECDEMETWPVVDGVIIRD